MVVPGRITSRVNPGRWLTQGNQARMSHPAHSTTHGQEVFRGEKPAPSRLRFSSPCRRVEPGAAGERRLELALISVTLSCGYKSHPYVYGLPAQKPRARTPLGRRALGQNCSSLTIS